MTMESQHLNFSKIKVNFFLMIAVYQIMSNLKTDELFLKQFGNLKDFSAFNLNTQIK